jgi:gliding motility-associated-like protein
MSLTSSHEPTELLEIGVTTVTYTALDKYNNSSTCSFTVTVTDNSAPVITNCPADITIEAQSSCQAEVTWSPPAASDNCLVILSSSHNPGLFNIGTTTVIYTATDPSNNSSTCSFTVTVTDDTAPVFANCPADITMEAQGSCKAAVTWTPPTVTDNCSSTLSASHDPGLFDTGTTTITYTAVDPAGNTSTCSFNVIVRDTTVPVISGCPSDITITTASCESPATWTPPIVADHCTPTLKASHQSGDIFPLGITAITYTASDDAGNTAICSFNVTVRTDAKPVVNGCPDSITIHTFDDAVAVTWDAPQANPFCGSISQSASHQPGAQFSAGVTEVVYEFRDDTGNMSACSFNVTVIKDELSFEVSKVITPNGDGTNDTWWMTDIEKFKDNAVLVVDRWGNKIYHSIGYNNADVVWTGTGPGGGKVPVGTYFYTVEVRVKESVIRNSGFIEVIY